MRCAGRPCNRIPKAFTVYSSMSVLAIDIGSGNLAELATMGAKPMAPVTDDSTRSQVHAVDHTARIPSGRYVRAMYGAITKPLPDSTVPKDVEKITSDADLSNFFEVTSGAYKPIIVLVQLAATVNEATQAPTPNDWKYFGKNEFDTKAGGTIMTLLFPVLKLNYTSLSSARERPEHGQGATMV